MCWEIVSAISSVIAAAASFIAAAAIAVIIWQACTLRKEFRLNAFSSLLETWGDENDRKARQFILHDFEFNGNLNELGDEQREKVELVLARCNRISLMTSERLIPEKDVLRLVGRSMIRCWDKLEVFVEARRKQAGESEEGEEWGYMHPFQQFVINNRTKVGL